MKTEELFQAKDTCCGCELCALYCPQNIIRMAEDEEGFLYPCIADNTDCIDCKKCITVCPSKTPGRQGHSIQNSFSFSLRTVEDLKRSASGGLATAISRKFVENGGVVYGVTYSDDFRVIRYSRAQSVDGLEKFRGSKYAQALKGDVYLKVKQDLKVGNKVLFIGLPCEISALYHAVGEKENLYSISLICHGPTSQKVHRDYCKSLSNTNNTQISFFSVRYKKIGWKPYFIQVNFVDGREHSEVWGPSDYGMAFIYMKRPSCRTCKYKAENNEFGMLADMVIGDFHGVNKKSKEYNIWGVSQGSILTEKGKELSSLIQEDYDMTVIPYDHVRITNQGLFMPIPQLGNRRRFVEDYLNHSLNYACHSNMVKRSNRLKVLKDKVFRIFNVIKEPSKLLKAIRRLVGIV